MRTVLWLLASAATGVLAGRSVPFSEAVDETYFDLPRPQAKRPHFRSYVPFRNPSHREARIEARTTPPPTIDLNVATLRSSCAESSASRAFETRDKGSKSTTSHGHDGWTTFKWGSTHLSYSVPTYERTSSMKTSPQRTSSVYLPAPKTYTHSTSASYYGSTPQSYALSSQSTYLQPPPPLVTTPNVLPVPSSRPTGPSSCPDSTPAYPSESQMSLYSHTRTHTRTHTSSCSMPTPTPYTAPCVPCEGQPSSDPDAFCGYTINDDSYEIIPKTCRTVYYNFEITNTTLAPDGIERLGLLINGQMPGPKIEANWGDTIVVRVTNKMANNGTSIHFHGMRQFKTNEMDGVPSVTQCPIAPGDTMVYTFAASSYGTSWYHSHFALQTYEGVFGPMIIHGPCAIEYDEEQTIVLQDWSHDTVDSMYAAAQDALAGGPRTLDLGLINGIGRWTTNEYIGGGYFQMNVVSGKTYRLRVVNTAIQSTFKFHIDGHMFRVIAADFVPIQPYNTDILNINIGQRYDLIMTADQPCGNYWMRADNQQPCAQLHQPNALGIVRYADAPVATPTSTGKVYTPECIDEPYASLVPIVRINAEAHYDELIDKTVLVGPNGGSPNLFKWTLSGTTFQSQWGQPTLQQIVDNGTAPTYSGDLTINVPNLGEWVYIIIDSPIPLPHPIHLHGHDFLILGQGQGLYDGNAILNTVNPPRRDVALMPWDPVNLTGGYLVLAFKTDNPGAWLMHCHIGWHVSMGFALQIIEDIEGIKQTVRNSCQVKAICKNWHKYAAAFQIQTDDSGV